MKAKKFILKVISLAGKNGIRLDRILDKLNAQFVNKYFSDQFIIDFLSKRKDIEQFFMHLDRRTYIAYKMKER